MVKKNIAGLVFLNSKGLKLLFWAINLLPLLGSERVANINLSKRREFLPYSLNLIVIQRLYSRNDCLCILDILEEYTHPAPYLTWRLSLLDSRSITKYHMSVDSKDVKLLFKLETKVGACDEHYSHFLSPLFPLSPHTIASPPGDLRKKKTKSRKHLPTIIASWQWGRIFLISRILLLQHLNSYDMSWLKNRAQDKAFMWMLYCRAGLGEAGAIPGWQEWGKRVCEAQREGGSLLPWPQASKENSWSYGPFSCLQVYPLEPLDVEAVLCEKEVNLSVGFLLMALIGQNLPHFCCVTWPHWTSDGKFVSHASQPRASVSLLKLLWLCYEGSHTSLQSST